ncbi:hypothetical protein [Crossiella sp. CA198]|uniref:hypothetical protein n=1 Tax=Crossiella sp. CA198 TaxID=3455607 RepID=UPI003F8D18DE
MPIPAEQARRLRTLGGWFAMLIGSSAVVLAAVVLLLGGQLTTGPGEFVVLVDMLALALDAVLALTGFLFLNPWRHLRGNHIELLLVQRSRQMLGLGWGLMMFFALGLTFFLLVVLRAEVRRGGQIDGWDWVFVVVAYLPIVLQGMAFFLGRRLYPRPNL